MLAEVGLNGTDIVAKSNCSVRPELLLGLDGAQAISLDGWICHDGAESFSVDAVRVGWRSVLKMDASSPGTIPPL